MQDPEEFEDDDEIWGEVMYLEAEPLTKYHFYDFFFTVIIGFLRTLIEAVCNLGNAVTGQQVYEANKKDFEDAVRLDLETLPTEE